MICYNKYQTNVAQHPQNTSENFESMLLIPSSPHGQNVWKIFRKKSSEKSLEFRTYFL